ncbi:hypothetical protein C8R43DRAFT_955695 [Mycena crocata]|nr:hypothetical protein C8R43DRAFT_955695 [Mycena crocata]
MPPYSITDLPVEILDVVLYDHLIATCDGWLCLIQQRNIILVICRFWTSLVRGFPHYWNVISLHLFLPPDFVKGCLKHCPTGPLSLSIHIDQYIQNSSPMGTFLAPRCASLPVFITQTLPLLSHHFPRVTTLHVEGHFAFHILDVMSALVNYDTTSIVDATFISQATTILHPLDTCPTLPILKVLVLRTIFPLALGRSVYTTVTSLKIGYLPWPFWLDATELLSALECAVQLTSLDLDDVQSNFLESMFRACPQLFADVHEFRLRCRMRTVDLDIIAPGLHNLSSFDMRHCRLDLKHAIDALLSPTASGLHSLRVLILPPSYSLVALQRYLLAARGRFHPEFALWTPIYNTTDATEWRIEGESLISTVKVDESLRPMVSLDSYNVKFAATRTTSTKDGFGSIFAYRPLQGRDFLRNGEHRHCPRTQRMVFAGCVTAMKRQNDTEKIFGQTTFVTLSAPPDVNAVGEALCARQERFLAQIRDADVHESGVPCDVWWGEEAVHHEVPTIVISLTFPRNLEMVPGRSRYSINFAIGDDIIVDAYMIRTDTELNGVIKMVTDFISLYYSLKAGTYVLPSVQMSKTLDEMTRVRVKTTANNNSRRGRRIYLTMGATQSEILIIRLGNGWLRILCTVNFQQSVYIWTPLVAPLVGTVYWAHWDSATNGWGPAELIPAVPSMSNYDTCMLGGWGGGGWSDVGASTE